LSRSAPNHYSILGLDRCCSPKQVRDAYRVLAKQHHPDLNPDATDASARTQALNCAYEILIDPTLRKIYDEELAAAEKERRLHVSKNERNISQDLHVPLEEFFRGTTREVRINDPGNPRGREIYELTIPPATAPGTRFRLRRNDGGIVTIRIKPFPHFQFKVRGSDLRCDLKINSQLATQGGAQTIKGILRSMLKVKIPARVERGEIIRVPGEGLPKPRGGRGDLLLRILYRPEVRITRGGSI
jgi:curved DNA-binding protein